MADNISYRVTVHGLEPWKRHLVQAQVKVPYYVRDANKKVADMVSNETRRRMERQFKLPRGERTGALAMSVFHMADPTITEGLQGRLIVLGGFGDEIPYAGWWEYGYEKDVHPPPFRLFAPRGRTLYPAIRKLYPQIRAIYETVATRLSNAVSRGEL